MGFKFHYMGVNRGLKHFENKSINKCGDRQDDASGHHPINRGNAAMQQVRVVNGHTGDHSPVAQAVKTLKKMANHRIFLGYPRSLAGKQFSLGYGHRYDCQNSLLLLISSAGISPC